MIKSKIKYDGRLGSSSWEMDSPTRSQAHEVESDGEVDIVDYPGSEESMVILLRGKPWIKLKTPLRRKPGIKRKTPLFRVAAP